MQRRKADIPTNEAIPPIRRISEHVSLKVRLGEEVKTPGTPEFLLTVVLLCRNHAAFVEEALESVRSQTVREMELRIYDIGSEDNSGAKIESWISRNSGTLRNVTFHRHVENIGVVRALKFALAEARGKYIRTLSTDDSFSRRDSLTLQLAGLEQCTDNVAVCFSDMYVVDSDGNLIETRKILPDLNDTSVLNHRVVRRKLMSGNWIPAPAVMLRANAVDSIVANLDEDLVFEDFQLWMDLSLAHDFLYLPRPLVNYRQHNQSFTRNMSLARLLLRGELKILLRALQISPELGLGVLGAARSLFTRAFKLRDTRSVVWAGAIIALGLLSPMLAIIVDSRKGASMSR